MSQPNSATGAERLFTGEELDRLATPTSILLENAASDPTGGAIDEIVQRMNAEHLAIYDAYIQWLGVLQSHIIEKEGEQRHREALKRVVDATLSEFVLEFENVTFRERVEMLAGRFRAGGSTFDVTEHADQVTFSLDPWGPARLWYAEQEQKRDGNRYEYPCYGLYDEPTSFARLEEAHDVTGGRTDVPGYLATEILSLVIQPIELLGYPLVVFDFPDGVESETELHVYKDPAEIPAEVYDRVGTAKPSRGFPTAADDRVFTSAELDQLGTPLSIQVEESAKAEETAQLEAVADRYDEELIRYKDQLGLIIGGLLTWIARHRGEDAVAEVLADTAEVVMTPFIEVIKPMSRKEQIGMWAMVFRAHGSTFSDGPNPGIEEYDDRVVFRGRPLGACGRMWANDDQERIERISETRIRYPTFGCYDKPMHFHRLREPRDITHMNEDYPIYSAHCHALHEVFCTNEFGYPLWVEEHPVDDENGVTRHVHYKDPTDWPEEFYTQIGEQRPESLPENAP